MVRAGLLAVIATLAVAGAAQADTTTKVTYSAGSQLGGYYGTDLGYGKGELSGAAYNSFVNVTPNDVTFESSNANALAADLNSSSTVTIGFTNMGTKPLVPTVHSQITPAGIGFYLADMSNCTAGFGTCAEATGYTFNDLGISGGEPITLAAFSFSIVADDHTVFSATGSVGLEAIDSTFGVSTFSTDARSLTGFHQEIGPATGDDSAYGYHWHATDIDFSLFNTLNPGESDSVTYQTSVTTGTNTLCVPGTTVCVVAYSGFGDPIGRGGGVDSLSVTHGGDVSAFDSPQGGIQGLQFSDFTLHPTFVNGVLNTNGGVPEPAVWISMLLGFGLMGAALRRRKGLAAA
jgi:hypothetical protein